MTEIKRLEERVKELEAALREINTLMYSDDYGDLYVRFDEALLFKLDALLAAERPEAENK